MRSPDSRPQRLRRLGRCSLLVCALSVLVLSTWPVRADDAPGDAIAGSRLYTLCEACHGSDGEGNRAMNAPRLAGLGGWYIARQLEAYRAGLRGTVGGDVYGSQMRPMAMTVSAPEAQADLIAHITTLDADPPPPAGNGDVAAGEVLFVVCAACHGERAEGNAEMGGPPLAGQRDWYLVRQLQNFRSGRRGTHPDDFWGGRMRPMAVALPSDSAVMDVVAYISTLP